MAASRAITKLELRPVYVLDQPGWVEARWSRADGSEGSAAFSFKVRFHGANWERSSMFTFDPTTEALRDIPLARIETAVNADPKICGWLEESEDEQGKNLMKLARRFVASRMKLQRPPKGGLNDAFYSHLADAYRDAARVGLNPSKTLADDSGVPQGTVNRWVAEARRRGYLPEGQKGKVTI